MAYRYFKDFLITENSLVSDKLLRDKEFNIGKNLKYCRYQRDLVSVV